jgi:aminomethyltransferase
MTEEGKRSPLHDWHVAHGAEIIWEDGYPWTNHQGGDPIAEYEAIRTGTGIWDLFSTAKYEVTGPDAGRLIQRRFTNAIDGMTDGGARYGAFVNADGLMVDDGNVYRLAGDRYWVMINSAGIQDWFRETAEGLNARIEHRTDELAMIAVQGPTSQRTLQPLVDRDLAELRYFRFWPEPTTVAGAESWVLRTGFSGERGYEVVLSAGDAPKVWEALVDAGCVPFGLAAIEIARIEAGLVIIALDYQPGETSPWDLSMDRFIRTDTGCVGAAALAERGADPPKRLKSVRIDADAAPEYGVVATRGGEPVGTVTSPAVSPRLGTIGLAVLDAAAAADGTELEVAVGERTAPATVAPLSLYDPDKARPRS